jgi:hypothetical protein
MKEKYFYTGWIQYKSKSAHKEDFFKINLKKKSNIKIVLKNKEKCDQRYGYEGFTLGIYSKQEVNNPIQRIKSEFDKQEVSTRVTLDQGEHYFRVFLNSVNCVYRKYDIAYIRVD